MSTSVSRTESTVSSLCSDSHNISERDFDATSPTPIREIKAIGVVGEALTGNAELQKAVSDLGLAPIHYATATDAVHDPNLKQTSMVFVIDDFESQKTFLKTFRHCRVYGPTAIKESAGRGQGLIETRWSSQGFYRPLYTAAMVNKTICFSGYPKRSRLYYKLLNRIYWMGGVVRESNNNWTDITHVVSRAAGGYTNKLASLFGKPIMSAEWIDAVWDKRHTTGITASDNEFMGYKLKTFEKLCLCLVGFDPTVREEMAQLAAEHGASVTTSLYKADHIVVDIVNLPDYALPEDLTSNSKCHVVSAEWFWVSIRFEVIANEDRHPIKQEHPNGLCTMPLELLQASLRRQSSASNVLGHPDASLSMGSLDISANDSVLEPPRPSVESASQPPRSPQKSMTKRHQICWELLQTEINYIKVLRTIINVFLKPLEDKNHQLLESIEIRDIFSNIRKIHDVHESILKELNNLITHWHEERLIGQVWLDAHDVLKEAYPGFIKFYDKSIDTLKSCAARNPKFYAFLKAGECKPECGRQTLQELLIRPIQRLPSVQLLLTDILKRSDKNNPDKETLQRALDSLVDVLSYINEGKRQTDARFDLFTICSDIENMPPDLLSAHRQIVGQVAVEETSHHIVGKTKHQPLLMILFNDFLEVAKFRSNNKNKRYKHLETFRLSFIRRVIDMDGDEFCLVSRKQDDNLREHRIVFRYLPQTPDNKLSKGDFLKLLCQTVAKFTGEYYKEKEMLTRTSFVSESPMDTSITSVHNITRPLTRIGDRMNRALSFTNSPRSLKRTISSAVGGMSGTLKRMSRSNLRLMENGEPMPPSSSGMMTLRSRLSRYDSTQSLFTDSAHKCLTPIAEPTTSSPVPRSAPPNQKARNLQIHDSFPESPI